MKPEIYYMPKRESITSGALHDAIDFLALEIALVNSCREVGSGCHVGLDAWLGEECSM